MQIAVHCSENYFEISLSQEAGASGKTQKKTPKSQGQN